MHVNLDHTLAFVKNQLSLLAICGQHRVVSGPKF